METKYFFNKTWESVEFLGNGSFGKVYKARKVDDEIEQFSAIKEITIPNDIEIVNSLSTEGLSSQEIDEELADIKNKFINEIKVMYELKNSNNIVKIEDFEEQSIQVEGEKYSQKYIINIRMELLESIDGYFFNDELKDKEIIRMALDILNALKECKKNKIIHRDIKPENIFVNKKGVYKLGDFGEAKNLSKTLSNMSRKGTENYMSPEIYRGDLADLTSDIYSLGIVLYRFFNNKKLPFIPQTNNKINAQVREEALLKRIKGENLSNPVNASGELASVIVKMCAYKKEDRYQDIDELIKVFKNIDSKMKKEKNIFRKIESDEADKTISLYGKKKKTKVEVLELTKDELKNGCTKVLTIDDKEYEVKVPASSEVDDEIVLEAETINGKKEKIAIVVVLSLLPIVPMNVEGEIPSVKPPKKVSIKPSHKPKSKGLVVKMSKGKLIGFGITAFGIIFLGVILFNNKPEEKSKPKVAKKVEPEQTAKILTCNVVEQEVDEPQKFTYKFYFDKSNNVVEKLEFSGEYPPLGGSSDISVVEGVADTIKNYFCGPEGITVEGTCDVNIEGLKIYSSYELKPDEFIESYEWEKEEGKTLLETIKDDYENRDPEGCYEMFTVSTQACGEIMKATCEVEEIK